MVRRKVVKTLSLFIILLICTCKTVPKVSESIEVEKEVSETIERNEKAKRTKNIKVITKALDDTGFILQGLKNKFKVCDVERAELLEEIRILEDELSTWTVIKWTFWIIVSLGGIFGAYLISKRI